MMENSSAQQLTQISANHLAYVTRDNLSAREAVAFLLNGIQLRTFRDIMRQVSGSDDQEQKIIKGLCSMNPTSQPDSIRRKVHNWMNGKSLPTEREDIFQLCFALELNQEQSDRMLALLTDHGIHYRNVREVVYAYCLRYHLPYSHACSLAEQFERKPVIGSQNAPVTQIIRQEFQSVQGEEDLLSFILRHQSNLGTQHNTAYAYFCKMLALLTGEALEGENTYSMEYVAEEYLRMNVPQEKKTERYTDIQKLVKKYWPSPRSIKAMKSRSEDIRRKTLLLLYLVTGGVWEQEYDELDETYIQPKEFLETHCRRMNRMLMECGMRRIDPRSAFDYLLLYCLRPEDELCMSQRMSALAAELFSEEL